MSFTQSQMVSLAVLEGAANEVMRAVVTQRPRYLHLDSANPTTPTSTFIAPLQLGPAKLDWTVDSPIPTIDLHQTEPAWPIQTGAPAFGLDEFGIYADPVKVSIGNLVNDVIALAITGRAQLVPTSPYTIEFHLLDAEAMPSQQQNTSPLTTSILWLFTLGLKQFLQGLSPVTMPLPPIAVGPIVPAVAPIIDNDEFVLRGTL